MQCSVFQDRRNWSRFGIQFEVVHDGSDWAANRELAAPSSSAPSSPSHSKWKEKSAKTLALQALAFGRETHAPMGRLARRQ